MRSAQVRRLLNKHAERREEWRCGRATVRFTGRSPWPRFDRRLEIFLDEAPALVDARKIARLLRLLDRLARKKRRDA